MKKLQIMAALMIVAAGLLFWQFRESVQPYQNFAGAEKKDGKVQIVGTLMKDKDIVYDPEVNADYFSFWMQDEDGAERQVVLNANKPTDFERTESIVLTGSMGDDDIFYATDMLLKCPSKYKAEETFVRAQNDL